MEQLDLVQNPEAFDNFWYQARRKLVAVLRTKYNIENKKILEVGCGAGSQLAALAAHNNSVVGSDINEEALNVARQRGLSVFFQDIEKTSADNEKYDVVCAFDVLEHINDDTRALRNISKMIAADGMFIFSVPAYQFLFSNHDKFTKHYRRYSTGELAGKLGNSGFTGIELYYWNSILFPLMAGKRLLSRKAEPKSDAVRLPRPANRFLYGVLVFENWLFKSGIRLPFGLSIIGVARKK